MPTAEEPFGEPGGTPDVDVWHCPGRCRFPPQEHPTSTSGIARGGADFLRRNTRRRRPTSPGAVQISSAETRDVDVRHCPGRCRFPPQEHATSTSDIARGGADFLRRNTRRRRPTLPGAVQISSAETRDVDVRHCPGRCRFPPQEHATSTSDITRGGADFLRRNTRRRRLALPGAVQIPSAGTRDVDVRHCLGRCRIRPQEHTTSTSDIARGGGEFLRPTS